jgi:integrase
MFSQGAHRDTSTVGVKHKAALDARLKDILPGMQPWTIHDLRRTARSLMSRADVRPDIAERVLGHAIGGVEGVYDRHDYFEQKSHAIARLSELVQTIIDPPRANVLALGKSRP